MVRGIILDFEAYAVVIGSKRQFLPVHLFTMLAALLLAEGDEIPTPQLFSFGQTSIRRDIPYVVNRDVRRLRHALALHEADIEISASRRGYTLHRIARGNKEDITLRPSL